MQLTGSSVGKMLPQVSQKVDKRNGQSSPDLGGKTLELESTD